MIVIIGNGISGITAARYIRKRSDQPIIIISEESKYFFSRTALMYVYMGHMKFEHTQPYEPHFWEENNFDLIHERVENVDTSNKSLTLSTGKILSFDKLIIATGSKPNKFNWKNQNAKRVGGLYSKQDLEYLEKYSNGLKSAVIVGGGLIGIELAEMLLSRGVEVHFLVREFNFWGSVLPKDDSQFIMKHISKHHGLNMHYGEELDEITVNSNNEAIGIITKTGRKIDCQFVGLTAGVSPNVDFLSRTNIEIDRGILVNDFLETSKKDIYAIGDCAQFRTPLPNRKAIEQVWYTGKFMGEIVAHTVTGQRRKYEPGHWFNSAKFFDIEYQTYGIVKNELEDIHDEFIYSDENRQLLLHFVFEKSTRKFVGINTFGLRLRHQILNQWLIDEVAIEFVIENLQSANFDPELHNKIETDLLTRYNSQFGAKLIMQRKKWWQDLIAN